MIDIKNKIITAILIVIVTMSMLASAVSEDVCDETGKVRIMTMDIDPVTSPTNIPTQIISGSGFADGCGHCGTKYPLILTVNGLPANIVGDPLSKTMTFSRSISLSEGENTITVTATIGPYCGSITKTTTIILNTKPPATSSITVTTNLSGATFSLTGASSYSGSGTSWSTANAPAGTYTITYGAVTGYNTPPSETKTLTAGGSIAFSGTYTRTSATTGSISVTTNLSGATFTLTGASSYSGNGTSWSTANAPAGTYTVTYGAVTGYNTPPSETKTLTAVGSITFSGTYVPKDTNGTAVSGLVAEWHFDGSAQDTSGSGNHGTISGATFVQGINGQALSFDGVDDYVNLGGETFDSLTDTTIELWVKPNNYNSPINTHFITFKHSGESPRIGLYFNANEKKFRWMTAPWYYDFAGATTVSLGNWQHVAVTISSTDGTKLYVNGNLDGSNAGTISFSQVAPTLVNIIGAWDPAGGSWFNGTIDEVRIYNRALSASEIQAEYNALINPPATVTPDNALYAEKRTVVVNESVLVPINIKNATNIGNMDILLTYNPNVVKATKVQKGSLTGDTMFDSNVQVAGEIRISFASTQGIKGDGSIAYIEFQAIGSTGSTSPVTLVEAFANEAGTMAKLDAALSHGEVRISEIPILKGDVNGDSVVSAADALMALNMAVGRISATAAADVNGDGRVTSADAVLILQAATGKITL